VFQGSPLAARIKTRVVIMVLAAGLQTPRSDDVGAEKAWLGNNLLPRVIIEQPFHTSVFFTHLKSISSIMYYHPFYDFGETTGVLSRSGKVQENLCRDEVARVRQKLCERSA
jgi:hypothetical protein